ncbi:hypothetical protein CDL15_Pgr016389 [Punica granatum]|uniref:Uncharacterized protein n=1 Tax=Punica granatum TaxID=22663 RepID=A0A218W6Q1_PUNGR|nr:hypothetical protein CDL15_Pgr016389 [Punica granatum]
MGEREDRDAPVDPPIMCGKTVEVVAPAGFDDLVAGWAKTESPPILVLLDFDGAADPLSLCSEAGAGDVIVSQENLSDHAVRAGRADFFVVSNNRDGLERVEREVLVILDVRTQISSCRGTHACA